MFQGFNESTIKYFEAIRRENSKSNYKVNEQLYFEGIKEPLEELYFELFNYFGGVDSALLSSKRRCVSSAYNDARFCREEPIKEYLYIRFKLDKSDKNSAIDSIQKFNEEGRLELQGDVYKRDNYPEADPVLDIYQLMKEAL